MSKAVSFYLGFLSLFASLYGGTLLWLTYEFADRMVIPPTVGVYVLGVTLSVVSFGLFIYCWVQNYKAHKKELKG